MRVLLLFGWLALGATAVPTSSRRMLLSVETTTHAQGDILKAAAESDLELDFWTQPRINGWTDVLVPGVRFQELKDSWTAAGMKVKVMHEDVDALIHDVDEQNARYKEQRTVAVGTTLYHNAYRSYGEYEADLVYLRYRFPHLIRFDESGRSLTRDRSVEGKVIHFLEVGADRSNPVIMMEVNIHAREWMTSASTFYIIDWLVTNYGVHADATLLLDNFNLVIIPVANPDGYEYSRQHSTLRLWRKNRRVNGNCIGVDLNRNFDVHWKAGYFCSDTYPGPSKNSEPETRAVQSIFKHYEQNMVMYLAVHCYAQVLMLPWAYKTDRNPVDELHHHYAKEMAREMQSVDYRYYGVGTPFGTIGYNAYGSSADWAWRQKEHDRGLYISIAYELRPESGHGFDGFVQKASEIVPTGRELLASIRKAGRMLDEDLQTQRI